MFFCLDLDLEVDFRVLVIFDERPVVRFGIVGFFVIMGVKLIMQIPWYFFEVRGLSISQITLMGVLVVLLVFLDSIDWMLSLEKRVAWLM